MSTGFLTVWKGDATGNGLYVTLMFLVAAFAPKAVQKFAEMKIGG
ncbi:unnamed protein product [marine sediment metagenome]|uniref:Uncharacterized protein n=1 Tax=marine sediment metagenome TaxID=412755 RepID=X1ARX5_9ZZZZ